MDEIEDVQWEPGTVRCGVRFEEERHCAVETRVLGDSDSDERVEEGDVVLEAWKGLGVE